MFIIQSLREFIDNPMGKGSNALSSRHIIKEDLNRRFERLVKEKAIKLEIYKDTISYYFHFIIPSESKRQNTYDVVLKFMVTEEEKHVLSDKNLNRYPVVFFSNSPSFTYTFAHSFRMYGLLVEELKTKYEKQVFDKLPITRNPGDIINYEKTIYFAARHLMLSPELMTKHYIDTKGKPFHLNAFKQKIRNTDQIQLEYQKEKRRVEKEKKKSTQTEQVTKRNSGTIDKTIGRAKYENSKGKISARSKIIPRSSTTSRKSSVKKITPR